MGSDTERKDMKRLYQQILDLKLDYAYIVEAGYDAIFFTLTERLLAAIKLLPTCASVHWRKPIASTLFAFPPGKLCHCLT